MNGATEIAVTDMLIDPIDTIGEFPFPVFPAAIQSIGERERHSLCNGRCILLQCFTVRRLVSILGEKSQKAFYFIQSACCSVHDKSSRHQLGCIVFTIETN